MTADVLNPVLDVNVNATLRALSSAQLNPVLKAPNSVNVILRVLNSLSPKSVRMIFQRLKVELPSVGQTKASVQKTLFLEKEKV